MKRISLFILSLALASTATYAAAQVGTKQTKNINSKQAVINFADKSNSTATLSPAIKTKSAIYISGQIPTNPKTGQLAEGSFADQFTQAVKNLSTVAQAAGGSLDQISKVTVFITDMKNYRDINTVMQAYFSKPYPARSVIGVKELPLGATVEIEAIMDINKESTHSH